MEEINRLFGETDPHVRSRSLASNTSQSTASKLLLRQRLHQLMTCIDDLGPRDELHLKVSRALDGAFLLCGRRAGMPRKDRFRWTWMDG